MPSLSSSASPARQPLPDASVELFVPRFQVDDEPSEASSTLCDHLGIDLLPTVQFWQNGVKVWEHKGVQQMEQDLGEGRCMVYTGWDWVADATLRLEARDSSLQTYGGELQSMMFAAAGKALKGTMHDHQYPQ